MPDSLHHTTPHRQGRQGVRKGPGWEKADEQPPESASDRVRLLSRLLLAWLAARAVTPENQSQLQPSLTRDIAPAVSFAPDGDSCAIASGNDFNLARSARRDLELPPEILDPAVC